MNIQINENEVLYILQIIKLGDASGLNSIIHHLLRYTANSVNNYLAVFLFSICPYDMGSFQTIGKYMFLCLYLSVVKYNCR
jgi:hypothetical protein